jgi:predicted nuclease of predicted toxin-antitoxin system
MLLFDENLSHTLCTRLNAIYPNSQHVRNIALGEGDDAIWRFAEAKGLIIVSKDQDFQQRSLLYGAPPKCVWLRLGNCSTEDVASLLTGRRRTITAFAADESAMLILTKTGWLKV